MAWMQIMGADSVDYHRATVLARATTTPVPVAEAVLAALVGQKCTLVRDSVAEQLVVGFGTLTHADWPLRNPVRAPWLLYSRYGKWEVTDGVRIVANDGEPLGAKSLQQVRALMLRQHVSDVKVETLTIACLSRSKNGARLDLKAEASAEPDEDAWSLYAPGELLIEAHPGRHLVVVRRGPQVKKPQLSDVAEVHDLIRAVAAQMGLAVYEPPPTGAAGFDAVLTAPDGTVVLIQMKSTSDNSGFVIRAVAVRKDASAPTATEIPLTGLSADSMAAHLQHAFAAA